MEPNEVMELKEHAEGGNETGFQEVAFTMALLAVMVAVTTVLGHRTHTEAVLTQNEATDQWNLYQAKKIRSSDTTLMSDLLSVVTIKDADAAQKIAKSYKDHQDKWVDDLKSEQEKAEALEAKVKEAEARADRFDLGEAMLEIALVVTSITLLTRKRLFWFVGMGFALIGILSAVSVLMLK